MKKKTAKEIIEIIEELGISVNNFAYGELYIADSILDKLNKELVEELESIRKIKYSNRTSEQSKRHYEIYQILEQEALKISGIGQWEEVEQVGGEGQGDHWHSVKYFKDHDVYIMTIGRYSSYEGTEFYDGYGKQVFPKQKTITVYE